MKDSIPEARRPIHRQMFPRRSSEEENREDGKIKKTELVRFNEITMKIIIYALGCNDSDHNFYLTS